MDDQNKNLILATVLSTVVLVVWYTVFAPATPPQPAPDLAATTAQTTAAPDATPTAAVTAATEVPVASPADAPRIKIDTPRLSGSISLMGGSLDDLALKDYRDTLDPASAQVQLLSYGGQTGTDGGPTKPYFANYGWTPLDGMDDKLLPGRDTLWSVESGTSVAPGAPVILTWDNGAGLIFHREIAVDDSYMFTVTQRVENHMAKPVKLQPYGLVLRQGAPKTTGTYVLHEGLIRMADGKLLEVKYSKMPGLDVNPAEGEPASVTDATTGGWVGFTDKYWMATLIPTPGQPFTAVVKYRPEGETFIASARLPVQEVAPGQTASASLMLFAGAKEWETIKRYESTLKIDRFIDSIDWGWFYFLTKPMFWLLHHLHGLIGNMGLAIIALTFIIKALVFPLARKSYISMAKMKELQPEIEKMKEAAGDDRAKVQQGMMALYRKEKVNPASGCLPVFLQIPIFYSLYKVIYVTLELRQAPFVGWIRDLSSPDPSSIQNLFGLLPWSAPIAGVPLILSLGVLPILLGISMWFQQKLNPAPADAAQAQIFAWMPWIFMFMLGSFPSGLVLYWITNNTITFLQQYTIMSMHGKRPDIFGNIKSGMKREKPAAK